MAPLKDSEQKELLSLEEETYEMEGFTRTEMMMMRMLVRDRIADRFRMAQKASESMDIVLLKGCVDELIRLDELASKLTEEAWHEGR